MSVRKPIPDITTKQFEDKYTNVSLTKEERNRMADELLGDVASIVQAAGFKTVKIRACAPYFNDGDPCEFTLVDPYIDGYDSSLNTDGDDDVDDVDEEAKPGEVKLDEIRYGTPEFEKESKPRRKVTELIFRAEDRLHRIFDTDFDINLTVHPNGKFSYTVEEYDPGH